MTLTKAEQRILRAALREFDGTFRAEFDTLRDHHPFLQDGDEEVNLHVLAQKLEVEVADHRR
jgi:hypothetical protein